MPRISIFIHSLAVGGAERVAVNLANGFSDHGNSVEFVLANAKGKFLSLVDDDVGITGLDIPSTKLGVLGGTPHLRAYCKRTAPDVLLSVGNHNNIPSIIATRGVSNRPHLIVTEHNDPNNSRSEDSLRERAVQQLSKLLYPYADEIVAVSKGTASGLATKTGIPSEEIDTIYNPIVTPTLKKRAQEPVSHPWFSDPDQQIILSAGRLGPRKDFDTLLNAFSRLTTEKDVKLCIVGYGPKKEWIERRITELGITDDVAMLGFVDNPYKYMANSSVFVLSSRWEGFGNVLVEALASGCPVVSTDCPSGPSEILSGGAYGTLVPTENPAAMANAITDTLENPPSEQTCAERANEFTVETIIAKYEQLEFPT